MSKSALNLVVTGTASGRVVMLEAEADNLDAALFVDGVECGLCQVYYVILIIIFIIII